MDYKDSISLEKEYSDAANSLSNLRTRLALIHWSYKIQTDFDKIQSLYIISFKSFMNKRLQSQAIIYFLLWFSFADVGLLVVMI